MLKRLLPFVFVACFCSAGLVLAQTAQEIPQPNEVTSQQPALDQSAEPAVVAPPAAVVVTGPTRAPDEKFGGADGVYRMVVLGDSVGGGLGAGLARLTELDPRFEVVNRSNEASGLARTEVYDWPAAVAKILKGSSFDSVVVLIGVNDRQPIRVDKKTKIEYGTPEWTAAYKIKIDTLLARIKEGNARTFWVVLPPMQDPEFETHMQAVRELQQERVTLAGETLVDIRPPLTNPDGSFMIGDLDSKGKPRRLRTKDGIKFSRAGNNYLSDLVMGAIRKAENIRDLQATGEDETAPEAQVAVAVPITASPLFGQSGVDGVEVTYEAEALAREVPQAIAPDLSNAGKLGLRIARNSLAQRFYRTGEVAGAPYGRFDDFSVARPKP